MAADNEDSLPLHELYTWQRIVSGLVALLVALAAAGYVVWPRTARVVAPQCVEGGDCAVTVSAPVDSIIVSALIISVALFALMGITGFAWTPSFGNGTGLSAVRAPQAESVAAIPEGVPARASELDDFLLNGESASESEAGPRPGRSVDTDRVHSLLRTLNSTSLWNEVPEDMQKVAVDFAAERWGISEAELRQSLVEVAHEGGQGNKPYYVKFDIGEGPNVIKLTKGGRGKSGPTPSEHR
ncbi:hypothetical protein [Georgenia satyanarayanai]|uniref:hypothetical protein n=1 Tax=Georgenia satyanarayanai TaxID=860221 RepID=UPI0011B44708|nr:hypothetical protein [Georgenia satyanarayanai]